jgi:hypothetical protein
VGDRRSRPGLLALAVVLVAGCSSQTTLTASELIDRINAEGVAIVLGQRLTSQSEARELYSVRMPPLRGEPKPAPGSEAKPGASGSLYVFDDTGGAEDQLKACQAATGLVCFRAQNIVVVLDEESSRLEARRLGVAVSRLPAR